MTTRLANKIVLLSVAVVGLTSVVPAFAQEGAGEGGSKTTASAGAAETMEASVLTYAWYWKEQQQQKVTNPVDGSDLITLELKNPYCPDTSPAGSPPEEACKPGRLPVEVRAGNYQRPEKLSAINIDLALVPPGSEITKLEVRLWEARDDISKATQYNVEGHRIQACEIFGIFGDGEARLYKERPNYECTSSDATANRNSVKVGKGDNQKEFFHWTLDLTKQAQEWMKKEVFFTSVMLTPAEPRDPTPQDQAWQVALAGPMETKYGIDTTVVFEAPDDLGLPTIPPPTTPTDGEDGFEDDGFDDSSASSDFAPSSTTTTTGSDSPTDVGTDTAAEDPASSEDAEETEEPTAAGDPALASDREGPPAGFPLYVWLAILAGMVGFSMVRSVVLEKNTGIRPDGVLAQIQKLNAQRRGTSVTSAGVATSPVAAIVAGLGALGGKISGGAGKIGRLVARKKG